MNWHKYPNFTEDEFKCSHTGECHMNKDFMRKLQALRTECDFAFHVTSGYRHPTHPIEAAKHKAGEHCYGKAVDIAISGNRAMIVLEKARKYGFIRLGVKQNKDGHFIHLGSALPSEGFSSTIWTY